MTSERELYALLIAALLRESPNDVAFDTGSLRKRGKWKNPDVTQISLERYRRLNKGEIVVTTYEVKQWQRWDVTAVFEAASHARFGHEAWVVLEWPTDNLVLPDPRVDQLVQECQRYGIGLATLQPHYSMHRLHDHIAAVPTKATDQDVDSWLEYALSRNSEAEKQFNRMMKDAKSGD